MISHVVWECVFWGTISPSMYRFYRICGLVNTFLASILFLYLVGGEWDYYKEARVPHPNHLGEF